MEGNSDLILRGSVPGNNSYQETCEKPDVNEKESLYKPTREMNVS
jgi:hypothetical protein